MRAQLARICWGRSTIFVFQVISEKTQHCEANILQGIWERFLYENNRNYSSRNLVTNLLSFLLCPLIETKNKNQIFRKLVVC